MEESNIVEFAGRDGISDPLTAGWQVNVFIHRETDLLRKGARQLLQSAIETELEPFLGQFADQKTSAGHAAVVRNGHHPERAVQTGIGPVTVKVPKVRSRTGDPISFRSALVPPYVRKAKSLEAALPWLYLKGISTGEMGSALKVLLGSEATGFSATTVARLKAEWASEYADWRKSDLGHDDWVYIWAGGIYSGLRGRDERLCALVVIGKYAWEEAFPRY